MDVEQLRGQVVTGLKCDFIDGSVNREPRNLLQLRFGVTGAL